MRRVAGALLVVGGVVFWCVAAVFYGWDRLMKWTGRIQEILNTFAAMHPLWINDDSGPAPTPRFRLNERFAQQVCFEFGNSYGLKRADPGRPVSSETLAYQSNGKLFGWSWENQHNGTVDQFPESEDLAGQVFVPVAPVDWFSGETPKPEPPAKPVYPGDDIGWQIGRVLDADYKRAGRSGLDAGSTVWSFRTAWDVANGEAVDSAIARHRAEWCAILGVPVIESGAGVDFPANRVLRQGEVPKR